MTKSGNSFSNLRPCVFLDRDGTINKEVGYINHPLRLELLPKAAKAIRKLNQLGILAIVVSNQAGVARGYFSYDVMLATFDRLKQLLAQRHAYLDAVYYALAHKSAADPKWRDDPELLRKPNTGMIKKAQSQWPIDMSRAYVVGDRMTDILFAHNANLTGILVKTGYGLGEYEYQSAQWSQQPDAITENLGDAVQWILSDLRKKGWRRDHSTSSC